MYAAALLKSGKKPFAAKVVEKFGGKAGDPKLAAVIANLKKGIRDGDAELDAKTWLTYFGEGD